MLDFKIKSKEEPSELYNIFHGYVEQPLVAFSPSLENLQLARKIILSKILRLLAVKFHWIELDFEEAQGAQNYFNAEKTDVELHNLKATELVTWNPEKHSRCV
jgi:hypothetical protein